MYVMGIDPTKVRTTLEGPEFDVGQVGMNATSDGTKGYIYVRSDATGITGDGYVCDYGAATYVASMSTTTTTAPGTGQGKGIGVARAAIVANGYGWLQVFGPGTIRVAASCAAFTQLNSTGTAGTIDDDATASSEVITGVAINTANGVAAGAVAGILTWPTVGRTL